MTTYFDGETKVRILEIIDSLVKDPELRESEDERIRKDIITAVEMYKDFTQGRKEEIYAYLEKQKEQNLIMAISPQLKEQKPVDDSASTMIPSCWRDENEEPKYKKEDYFCERCQANAFNAGRESVLKKPVEHPKMVEMLREHLENTPKEQLDVEFEELKNWNDVGPTVEEFFHGKPIEWNEKDEKMRACAISLLQISRDSGMAINPGFGKPVRAINKCIDWLKSLRPSWKPSEEQMKALKNSAYGSYQNGDGPILRELYEQLQKLKRGCCSYE